MAKKIVFLLVLLFGLFMATVTAYAGNPDATPSDTSFVNKSDLNVPASTIADKDSGTALPGKTATATPAPESNVSKDKPPVQAVPAEPKVTDYTEKYADLFLDPETKATDDFLVNVSWNHNELSLNPLSYRLSGSVVPNPENPSDIQKVVILFYIKENGKYVPLYLTDNKDEKTNKLEKSSIFVSYADLLNLGSDKTNDIRIVAFRKDDADNLVPGENLQITDISITVRKNLIESVPFIINTVIDALNKYQ